MKVILTGATGMIGKGVLLECLDDPRIEEVLTVSRSSVNLAHPKIREMRLSDLSEAATVSDQLTGYDACFFCMGVSAVGMSEEEYAHITHYTTIEFARVLHRANPEMVFNYVSGTGTDSSEAGRQMWARVKGRTENDLLNMGFRSAHMFRPGVIIPERGVTSRTKWYRIMYMITKPLFPLLRRMSSVVTTSMMGRAMINSAVSPASADILNPVDIRRMAS